MACCQCDELCAPAVEERVGAIDDRTGFQFAEGREGGLDFAFRAGLQDGELHSPHTRRFLHVSDCALLSRIVRVHQQGDHPGLGNKLGQQLKSLGLPLGGESFGGELLVRRRFNDIRCRRGSFLLDLGEQPGPERDGCPLSLRIIMGKTAGLEDYGAQLGDAAATSVVEVHKWKTGPGHRLLQERDRRRRRQAMLAAQMQKRADKTVAAASVVIRAARPVARLAAPSSPSRQRRGLSGRSHLSAKQMPKKRTSFVRRPTGLVARQAKSRATADKSACVRAGGRSSRFSPPPGKTTPTFVVSHQQAYGIA
jgi:hypothetical protein